jgi:hypothetical protein
VRKRFVASCAFVALAACTPGAEAARAVASGCGLPAKTPVWIDFADGSVPFWKQFAQPGVVAAAANNIYPPQLRAGGAKTVYWDMYLNKRTGTPAAPEPDPNVVVAKANRLYEYAVASQDCATPVIAENELFGAHLVTPWSETNARYRANVLLYLRTLAQRGAHPMLLINSTPYTDGEAGDWWRQVAQVADLVREDYYNARYVWNQGPIVGSRFLRTAMRRSITDLTSIGIPPSKLGIMLGFQTGSGQGGREGLSPSQRWFETVKWQALAARQVASELKIATIWSWGWATYGTADADPDKAAAACVWLWTRAHGLCDGPAAAGSDFDDSVTDGQLRLPRNVQCTLGTAGRISAPAINTLRQLTGDREIAYTALLARTAESRYARVTTEDVLVAERVVVATRFHGSASAYRAALGSAHATLAIARGVIADELRRAEIESRLAAPAPGSAAISAFYLAYPDVLTRPVSASPAPAWLGGRKHGLALSSLAPPSIFTLPGGRKSRVRTMNGLFTVRPLGETMPLGAVPLDRARPAVSAALRQFARGAAFDRWTTQRQSGLLTAAICRRDDLPQAGAVELAAFLPFLEIPA